ncbi:hypothetical protein BC937DRAFT_87123 [Endogone sp. FLAS-F59071]|nr:hypothetical protein BC937DRAFT_87123 [Endogone sp. FLAS-F59071]|eukprot:RUS19671.1 hypothetical protein BC937DRAFT_87123 [Endogone sp. FLAS-F59071]
MAALRCCFSAKDSWLVAGGSSSDMSLSTGYPGMGGGRPCSVSRIPSTTFSNSASVSSFPSPPRTVQIFILRSSRLDANPMLMAVSSLSPVSTQTLMLALRSNSIACGTPSCNLSSIAVAPNSMRSRSISSYAASTLSALFSSDVDAALNRVLFWAQALEDDVISAFAEQDNIVPGCRAADDNRHPFAGGIELNDLQRLELVLGAENVNDKARATARNEREADIASGGDEGGLVGRLGLVIKRDLDGWIRRGKLVGDGRQALATLELEVDLGNVKLSSAPLHSSNGFRGEVCGGCIQRHAIGQVQFFLPRVYPIKRVTIM